MRRFADGEGSRRSRGGARGPSLGAAPRAACLASILLLAGLGLLAGCAPSRPSLPTVPPAELPERWLGELAREGCPPPFAAKLQIRAELEGAPTITLEGTIQAILPDTLRLTAGVGPFRPAFVLLARSDSCELLVHRGSRYWITSRETALPRASGPSVWSDALAWAVCPATFFARFRPAGTGRVEQGVWVVSGAVDGSEWQATVQVRLRDRSVRSLVISDETGVLTELAGVQLSAADGIWTPERLEISVPRDGLRLFIRRRSFSRLSPEHLPSLEFLRPPGWRPVIAGESIPWVDDGE